MKRGFLMGFVTCLACVLCMAADYVVNGNGGVVAGSSVNDYQGYFVAEGGSGTPGYFKAETVTDGTYQWIFPDKDGGWRTHSSEGSSDTDGYILLYSGYDFLTWEGELLFWEGQLVVENL